MQDSQSRAAEPPVPETRELPDLGAETRLVLMPVDPYLIYAYWNVALNRLDAAKTLFEEDEPWVGVLRFHDITGVDFDGVNSRSSFDVDVDLPGGRRYVRLWAPERKYCADLGLRGKDGRLVALVRSNVVETPPAWPHVAVEETAMVVEPDAQTASPADLPPAAASLVPGPRPSGRGSPEEPPVVLQPPPRKYPTAAEPPAPSGAPEQSSAPAVPAAATPPDAGEVLNRRIAQLSALRDEPLLEPVDRSGHAGQQSSEGPHNDALAAAAAGAGPRSDLTAMSEAEFVPGVSSALLGSRPPEK
jgi:hypothetical protein